MERRRYAISVFSLGRTFCDRPELYSASIVCEIDEHAVMPLRERSMIRTLGAEGYKRCECYPGRSFEMLLYYHRVTGLSSSLGFLLLV